MKTVDTFVIVAKISNSVTLFVTGFVLNVKKTFNWYYF